MVLMALMSFMGLMVLMALMVRIDDCFSLNFLGLSFRLGVFERELWSQD